jgi:hypothetical protein
METARTGPWIAHKERRFPNRREPIQKSPFLASASSLRTSFRKATLTQFASLPTIGVAREFPGPANRASSAGLIRPNQKSPNHLRPAPIKCEIDEKMFAFEYESSSNSR